MSFQTLYDHIQTLDPPIGRNSLIAEINALVGVRICFARVDLDLTVCRGMYLTPQNGNHRLVQQMGGKNVVAVGRGLNRCWERFVIAKEMMHTFDRPDEFSDTGDKFESVLRDFTQESAEGRTPQMNSEIASFWRALLVLCPEKARNDLLSRKAAHGMTNYEIALALRIPEQYVPSLFDPVFSRNRDIILSRS